MGAQERSLREVVRETLLRRIGDGHLNPGERVMEASLARDLGVSSIPVREAIRELVAMGVLEAERNRGAWVRKVSLNETVEALQARAALESLAAQTAAERLKGRGAPLRRVVRQIVAAARKRDFVAFQHHNQQFHRMIVEASGNGVVLRLWDSLAFEVRTRFVLEHVTSVDPVTLAKEHEPIADALDRGDAKKAAALLESHSQDMVRSLEQQARAQDPSARRTGDARRKSRSRRPASIH